MAPYPFQPSAFTLHLSLARHVLALPRAPARRMALETLGAETVFSASLHGWLNKKHN